MSIDAYTGNAFWGRRYGTNHPKLGLIFPGKRQGGVSSSNSKPTGPKLRLSRVMGRAMRSLIASRKVHR